MRMLASHLLGMDDTCKAFVARRDARGDAARAVVLFGGTRQWRDLLDDVDIRLWSLPHCGSVHRGFAARAERLCAERDLLEFCEAHAPVTLAGYSLGAGACVCVASALELHGVAVRSVHLYGAPRVGDARFAAWYDGRLGRRTRRYETPRDPVTMLPRHLHAVGRRVAVPCERKGAFGFAHHDLRAYASGLRSARV